MWKFPGDTWLEAKKKVNNKEDQNSIWDMTAKLWREETIEGPVIIVRMNQRNICVLYDKLESFQAPSVIRTFPILSTLFTRLVLARKKGW